MRARMKRVNIVALTSMVALSLLATISPAAQAADKSTKGKPSVAALKCRATTAVGHPPVKVGIPTIKKITPNYIITLTTNCGDIVIVTDGAAAPMTTTAMAYLAKQGFFNQTLCHRLTTAGIFVLQCGDPTATGTGGPNWQGYRDENLPPQPTKENPTDYPAGIVAMANSGPNTNGSQFFLVYANTSLPPSYTRWGVITKGLDIVKAIAAQGTTTGGPDGTPKQTVAIEKVTVR
jgi:peptidyl-prolyl cis-trans isomerase B (cyclophilin B)